MYMNALVIAGLALLDAMPVDAFWRLECRGRLSVARIDPIINPGVPSTHAHSLHGFNGISFRSGRKELRKGDCTSCAVKENKSAYWLPPMYFVYKNGSTQLVEQVGGLLAYYELDEKNIKAFPKGLKMVAGDPVLRTFDLPVPDPPKSLWKGNDSTQKALAAKAIGFNCLDYSRAAEPALNRHTLPEKKFIDSHCKDGIQMEIQFPSCWNGKDTESIDNSHIKYPSLVDGGNCPKGHETRLVSLFYESIWNTAAFRGVEGQFVLAHGDPTGAGYHADFLEGWDDGVLQKAVNTCTSKSGLQSDCPVFTIQEQPVQRKCNLKLPDIIKHENTAFIKHGLPGKCPITGHNNSVFPSLSLSSKGTSSTLPSPKSTAEPTST